MLISMPVPTRPATIEGAIAAANAAFAEHATSVFARCTTAGEAIKVIDAIICAALTPEELALFDAEVEAAKADIDAVDAARVAQVAA